jgi:ubiquinone biosynthesis monooxygenase Coq6
LKTLSPEIFSKLVQAAFTASIPDLEFLIERAMNKDLTLEDLDLSWRPPSSLEYIDEFPKIEHVQDKSRAMFPLKLRHVEKYCDDRLALAGDAAHTVHPLAGQGLNLGLMDAKSLAYTLAHGHNTGQDLGSIHLLKHYSTEQYTRNLIMLSATDKLYKLFSNKSDLLSQVRSLGIDVFNKVPGLKNFSVKHAMGI